MEGFTENSFDVYVYTGGPDEVRADPITIYMELAETCKGLLAGLLTARRSRDQGEAELATGRLEPVVRYVFELGANWTCADAMELLGDFLGWLYDEEVAGRETADMVAAYGSDVLKLPPLVYVRLWLNLPRVQKRQAMAVAAGFGIGATNDRVDRSFFEAVCTTRAEAEDAEFECNEARAFQRFMAGKGK